MSDYDYELPPELIANHPLPERDASRMMIVDRSTQSIHHQGIRDLPSFLQPGDCLILNDTRVVPAKLSGTREATGGKWEGLFLGVEESGAWRLLSKTRGKIQAGEWIRLNGNSSEESSYRLKFLNRTEEGGWFAEPEDQTSPYVVLDAVGEMPLPPYIEREQADAADSERYQTVFAKEQGAVAAPTAGLHFTPRLLDEIVARGVQIGYVTLHVGVGTFRPVSVDDLARHEMHSEWCRLPAPTAELITSTKHSGGMVYAVGTTAVRTLESVARSGGIRQWEGETNLFIRPPADFYAVDAMITNFHLPGSTLLMLVSAFAGYELIRTAYAEAVSRKYRFFTYGDSMLIHSSQRLGNRGDTV